MHHGSNLQHHHVAVLRTQRAQRSHDDCRSGGLLGVASVGSSVARSSCSATNSCRLPRRAPLVDPRALGNGEQPAAGRPVRLIEYRRRLPGTQQRLLHGVCARAWSPRVEDDARRTLPRARARRNAVTEKYLILVLVMALMRGSPGLHHYVRWAHRSFLPAGGQLAQRDRSLA